MPPNINDCLICLHPFRRENNQPPNYGKQEQFEKVVLPESGEDEGNGGGRSGRKDVYVRFLHLVKSYLELGFATKRFFEAVKEDENGEIIAPFCEQCYERIATICDLHEQLQVIEMELKWRLSGLGNFMDVSHRSMSQMRKNKLYISMSKQLGVNCQKSVSDFRQMVKFKCKGINNKSLPNVLVHRGLFPDYWKFTMSKTREMLIRLLVVFTLSSSQVAKANRNPSPSAAAPRKQNNSRLIGPRSRLPKGGRLQSSSKKDITSTPITEDTVKVETSEVPAEDVLEQEDPYISPADDNFGENDCDSDWSGGDPASPMSTHSDVAGVIGDTTETSPIKRWNLRRNRSTSEPDGEDNSDSGDDKARKRRKTSTDANKRHKCSQCPKVFRKSGGLASHVKQVHKSPTPWNCRVCGRLFKVRKDLRSHCKEMHRFIDRKLTTAETQCTRCALKFPSVLNMKRHRSQVHKRLKCPICFGTVFGQDSLKSHMEAHANNELIVATDDNDFHKRGLQFCEVCAKISYSEESIDKHMKEDHSGQYTCAVCDSNLESGKLLRDHWAGQHETEDKRYQCWVCLRGFTTQQFYDVHRMAHKNGYPCEQEDCSEVFNTIAEVNEHLKSHLNPTTGEGKSVEETILFCKTCEMGCLKKYSLTIHELLHTPVCVKGGGYDCPECGKNMSYLESLISHYNHQHKIQQKRYKCTFCPRSFLDPKSCKLHVKRHQEDRDSGKEFLCDICRICGAKTECLDSIELEEHFRKEHNIRKSKRPARTNPPQRLRKLRDLTQPNRVRGRKMFNGRMSRLNTFKCQLENCKKIFDKQILLLQHLEEVHEVTKEEKDIQCIYCYKKFAYQVTFRVHIGACHKSKPLTKFKCDQDNCEATPFVTLELLNDHLKAHLEGDGEEGKRIHFCGWCNWGFLNSGLHQLHELAHMEPQNDLYFCPQCNQAHEKLRYLIDHYSGEHGIHVKRYSCKENGCQRTFKCQAKYEAHLKRHKEGVQEELLGTENAAGREANDQSMICSDCGKVYPSRVLLQRHRRVEHPNLEGGGEYLCKKEGCSGTFLTKRQLLWHEKKYHGAMRPWICEQCGKGFVTKSHLQGHMNVHKEKGFICPICGVKLTRATSLKIHVAVHHDPNREKAHRCSECGQSFFSRDGLKYHFLSSHTSEAEWKYECSGCKKKFYRKLLLDGHKKVCMEKTDGGFG